MKVPVIVRSNAGNLELVSHMQNGLIYEQPEDFIGLFEQLKSSAELRSQLVNRSYELFQQKFSLKKESEAYERVIQRCYKSRLFEYA
jgi:glycosyltransferase involved in cell wall biosynthesis